VSWTDKTELDGGARGCGPNASDIARCARAGSTVRPGGDRGSPHGDRPATDRSYRRSDAESLRSFSRSPRRGAADALGRG
jgi:hypothetical protein